ncbi:MAG: dihydropteroate synthase [Alphaproteobacteria bacterium]|nr:dihydropteroate synthase [Alphaproteobacteria bacterium]
MRLEERFKWGTRTYVMGILNVTPDSFSGDGLIGEGEALERAMARAERFVAAGADILDVGGESTRPGAEPVGADGEAARVLPVIEALVAAHPGVVVSIDTFRSEVAAAALDAGAEIVNDVWALRADPDMARLAAEVGAPVILMHNRSKSNDIDVDARLGGEYRGADYDHLLDDIAAELGELASAAEAAGIARDQIVLDPGIGFGKTAVQNMALLNNLDRLKALGYPLLIGPSRKSFIGKVLDLPADERIEGTAAALAIGIARGADIVRVHDVEAMARVVRMTDAILRAPAAGAREPSPGAA